MQGLRHFAKMLERAKEGKRQRLSVAAPTDDDVLEGVKLAVEEGIVESILVGDADQIRSTAEKVGFNLEGVRLIDERDPTKACRTATKLVRDGEADLLMKGMVTTADLMRAVLDDTIGLRTGRILSHVSVFDIPNFDRLIFVTDGGINIAPNLSQKKEITQNAIDLARSLGVERPKVAALAAIETVNPSMPSTLEAACLAKMADRKQIKGGIVDGPLALDNAINLNAAREKGIESPVAGQADILLVPDIETGNLVGKSLVYFAGATLGGLVVGAAVPIVLTSRADLPISKLVSIALAVLASKRGEGSS